MDEQKAWIRARRKRRLRLTAAILAVCLLVTTYPNILETISVFAAGLRGDGGATSITGFVELPEETAKQTVPVGTDRSELELPDTLEAYVTVEDKNDTEDDRKPDDGDQNKDDGEDDGDSGQDKGNQENPDEGADETGNGENGGDTENPDEGDGKENTGEENGNGGDETGDGNGNGAGDNSGDDNSDENSGADNDTDSEEESDEVASGFGIQTGSFLMPVYMSENPEDALTVETLENTLPEGAESAPDTDNGGTADHTERNAETKTVTIEDITWQSEPVYDGDVEETYIFTAVLPEGFALTEGVSLPQITVTVQDDAAVQALIARIEALPDAQDYMEEEPDIDDWEGDEDAYEEAYAEWMEGLLVYAEEALAIWEEYEALTQELQALIPEELLAKLTAWVKIAETLSENTMVMAADDHTHNNISFAKWTSSVLPPQSSGNHYLSQNIDVEYDSASNANALSTPSNKTINLCLSGQIISYYSLRSIYQISGGNDGVTLNIYDCSGGGKMYCPNYQVIRINRGTLNLYSGEIVNDGTGEEAVMVGSDTGIGIGIGSPQANVYGGSITGGIELNSGSVSVSGGQITRADSHGIEMAGGGLTISGGTIETEASGCYAVYAAKGTVRIAGDATLNTAIYTVNPIQAEGTGVSGLNTTYRIVYSNVKDGDIIVKGSTDREHYQLVSDKYGLAVKDGNLIAAAKYKVTYNKNNGTIADEEKYTSYVYDVGLTLPKPTKTGYTFGGWYTSSNFSGTAVTEISTTDTGNKTYYAKWTADTYTVTYNKDGGTIANESSYTSYTYGTGLTLPTPTRTGYTFGGWYEDAACSGTKVTKISTTDTGNKTYYAKWTEAAYTVTYNKDGATIANESNYKSYTYGTGLTLPTPERTGYTFGGWYENADFSGTAVTKITTTDTGAKTYYAKWTANSYTITYKDKNNAIFSGTHGSNYPTKHIYGTATTLVSPTKTGYDFNGWYTDSGCTGSSVTSLGATSYTGNITLYAKWTAAAYTVTYNKNNGTIANESSYTSYTYGTGLTLPKPARTGHTFGGWYTSSDFSGTAVTKITTTDTGNKTYYAKWTANSYTVTYNKDGGTIANESNYTSYTYGTGLTLPTPKRQGYTFGGWYTSSGLTGTAVTKILTSDSGDKGYYAKWTAAAVTINATKCTHDGEPKVGESGGYSVTFTPESGYSIPAKVTVRIGGATLASDGYTYDNTTGTLTIPRDKITGDVTITAKAVKDPVKSGAGKDEPDNTAPAGEPDEDGGKVTYTGTYGEEYTPVIKAGGQEVNPGAKITWDEGEGKGEWSYRADPDDEITVEFRKRAVTGITVTPGTLTIYADDAANESIAALTAYLKEHSSAQAAYDNQTKGAVQADYTTTDSFAVKGRIYSYTASADGKTAGITLQVAPVTAAIKAPAALKKKLGSYTEADVKDWLPDTVEVTYTGGGTKPESRTVTWNTGAMGANFGASVGNETISGTVALPAWASGQDSVSIAIEFVDKNVLTDKQMKLSISGWAYGAKDAPAPKGSITVKDKEADYTYLYSADSGDTWIMAENLPKSGSGNIVPGTYLVEMTYTGTDYTGVKKASFTVTPKSLTVKKGTLEVENRNYDGTMDAILKEGGQPEFSGVIEGDDAILDGTLSAVFTKAGPQKSIPVTVTGFLLEGRDAGCYALKNTTLTLYATINNEDGTPPPSGSSGGNSGGKGDDDNGDGGNNGDDNDGGDNGGSTPEDDSDPGTPAVTPPAVTPPADTPQPAPEREDSPDKDPETQPAPQPEGKQEQNEETKDTETDKPGQDSDPAQPDNRSQPEDETIQTVPAVITGGRIVIDDGSTAGSGDPADGGKVVTGNIPGMADDGSMPKTSTLLAVGEGAVIVTVVCEDEGYAAGVRDTAAVANAVLTPEQIQLVNDGGTIEVRIDVKDISDSIPLQDKETVEKGCEAYGQYLPDLTLGAYVDISVYIKTGDSVWNAVTETKEPIEVVIGVPEELRDDAREYYIIRAHEGRHDLLNDMDDVPDTIAIITDMFSSYAIAYRLTGAADTMYGGVEIVDGVAKCRLCHICPTFRGVCCFIWLVIIVAVAVLVGLILYLRYFCIAYRRERRRN